MQAKSGKYQGLNSHIGFFALTAILAGLDIITKVVAFNLIPREIEREVIPPVLYFQLANNPGALFGIGADHTWLFILISFFTMGLIVWMYFALGRGNWVSTFGLALILGGAIGNLWDRIWFGHVRDFILLRAGDYSWPNFNIADVWICLGVGLLIFWTLRNPDISKETESKDRRGKAKAS